MQNANPAFLISLGRAPNSDIFLFDRKNIVSKVHVYFSVDNDKNWFVRDDSQEGTWLQTMTEEGLGVEVRLTKGEKVQLTSAFVGATKSMQT